MDITEATAYAKVRRAEWSEGAAVPTDVEALATLVKALEAAAKTAWAEGYLARTLDGDEFLKTPNPYDI